MYSVLCAFSTRLPKIWAPIGSAQGEAETETEERGRGETKQDSKFPFPHIVDSVTEF